jgi:hypothetical protein
VSDEPGGHGTQHVILQAMQAVLSDDHNYERGVATLTDLVDRIARNDDGTMLRAVATASARALATALERIAEDQGLAADDLVEVWFAE